MSSEPVLPEINTSTASLEKVLGKTWLQEIFDDLKAISEARRKSAEKARDLFI